MRKTAIGMLLCLSCIAPFSSGAVIFSGSVENINTVIPDGNLNGIQSSLTLTGLPNFIADSAVPEPAAPTLLVLGGLFAWLQRRR